MGRWYHSDDRVWLGHIPEAAGVFSDPELGYRGAVMSHRFPRLLPAFFAIMLFACGGQAPAPDGPAPVSVAGEARESAPSPDRGSVAERDPEPDSPAPEPDESASEPVAEPVPVAEPEPVVLDRPPFDAYISDELAGQTSPRGRAPRLVQVSVKGNEVTDEERWFRDNQLELPATGYALRDPNTPRYRGLPLWRRIASDQVVSIYGSFNSDRAIITGAASEDASLDFVFDVSAWTRAPGVKPGDEEFVAMEIPWAWVDGDRLYVCHAHRTYAESSKGKNAYISAIRIADGALLWRSPPLVANARNFELVQVGQRRVLVTGYGFTAEPDFLYLLDPDTGRVLSKKKLRKGPSYIIARDGLIYVRTYDRDYVFRLQP